MSARVDAAAAATADDSAETIRRLRYRYAGLMVLNAVVATLLLHQYFQRTYRTGMRLKSAAISLVFDKALVARREPDAPADADEAEGGGGSSPSGSSSSPKGGGAGGAARKREKGALVTNLMSVDAQRLQDNMTYMFSVVSGIYQILVTMYLLYGQVGLAAFGGLGVMLVFLPVTQRIVLVTRDYQKVVLRYKDRRIKLQAEALGGMKIVKLYGWEDPLGKELKRLRELELAALWQYKLAGVVSRCVFSVVPTVVAVATFSLYLFLGGELNVALVYTTLALFNVLRFPLMMVPRAIGSAVEASLSVDRIGRFLASPEATPLPALGARATSNPLRQDDAAVWFEGADLRWPAAADRPTGTGVELARSVDFRVKKGTLCAILGETGSGKSGLLAALLGEVDCVAGSNGLDGRVAYCAQSAWIQNATVRDNVLFGRPLDRARYAETLRRCALEADMDALADGDKTEIGEKGLTLSGGQKQRVALARAYYADADVYLLDDCLSAVDAHVAQHLFDHLIIHLRDDLQRTVVLVTHNLSTLRRCDQVVALRGRSIAYSGAPSGFFALGAGPDAHPLAKLAAARASRTESSASLDGLARAAEAKDAEDAKIEATKARALQRTASTPATAATPLTAAEHRARGVVKPETRAAFSTRAEISRRFARSPLSGHDDGRGYELSRRRRELENFPAFRSVAFPDRTRRRSNG